MITVAACLWEPNETSFKTSKCYDETWVDKLYRSFKRNLTIPFRFVCFTDRDRKFDEPIIQERLETNPPNYGCLIEPFKLDTPLIVCGLDMMIVKNIDHMARYCLEGQRIAAPKHPCHDWRGFINPVVFAPAGHREVYDKWCGENDMVWLNTFGLINTDDLWPNEIKSYRLHDIARHGLKGVRIVYCHGSQKPHELHKRAAWVREVWK